MLLLLYSFFIRMETIFWISSLIQKNLCKVCSIYSGCLILEEKDHPLFVQIWSGCDVVFATYGKGKATCFGTLNQSIKLKSCLISVSDI